MVANAQDPPALMVKSHEAATRTPLPEMVRGLIDNLGGTLVAFASGTRTRNDVYNWRDGTKPREEVRKRLVAAWQAFGIVAESDGADIARAWMIGMNPRLSDQSPAERIREGDFSSVLAAAQSFAVGSGGA